MTLANKVDQFGVDADIIHQIANGDTKTVVQTAGGPVRSMAKLVADNQAALDGLGAIATNKEPVIAAGTTAQYWRGDKTWVSFGTTMINTTVGTIPSFNPGAIVSPSALTLLAALTNLYGNSIYLQASKLAIAGGTMTGALVGSTPTNYAAVTNAIAAPIGVSEIAVTQGAPSFTPMIHQATTVNGYGFRQHLTIGAYRSGTQTYGDGYFFGLGGSDTTLTEYFLMRNGGILAHSSGTISTPGSFYALNALIGSASMMAVTNNSDYNAIAVAGDALYKGQSVTTPVILAMHNGSAIRLSSNGIAMRTANAAKDLFNIDNAGAMYAQASYFGGATSGYTNYASAMTINYTGAGNLYGLALKPAASGANSNAITFLTSGSTYAAGVQMAAIQHLAGDAGINLVGNWQLNGTAIGGGGAVTLLGTATVSVATGAIQFLTTFSANYDKYVIEYEGITGSTTAATLLLNFATAGAFDATSGNYFSAVGGAGTMVTNTGVTLGNTFTAAGGTVEIANANSSTAANFKTYSVRASYYNGTNYIGIAVQGIYKPAAVCTGFMISMSAGSITGGTVRVFGVKNN